MVFENKNNLQKIGRFSQISVTWPFLEKHESTKKYFAN